MLPYQLSESSKIDTRLALGFFQTMPGSAAPAFAPWEVILQPLKPLRRALFLPLLIMGGTPVAFLATAHAFSALKLFENFWIYLVFALLIVVISAAALASRSVRPIQDLVQSTMQLTQGKTGIQIDKSPYQEINQLVQIFNYASQQLMAFENETSRLYQNLETGYLETMVLIANTIDRKDSFTHGHSQRVGDWASELGKEMGLPEVQVRHLLYGGLLHDVGKIGVIEPILGKRSSLTIEEMDAMRAHPVIGASIIASVSFLKPVMSAVRNHHERWDGSGYPDGLRGEEIPVLARIVAVADTWDALTSERPYQMPMTTDRALRLMQDMKSRLLDPEAVDALVRIVLKKQARGERISLADEVM